MISRCRRRKPLPSIVNVPKCFWVEMLHFFAYFVINFDFPPLEVALYVSAEGAFNHNSLSSVAVARQANEAEQIRYWPHKNRQPARCRIPKISPREAHVITSCGQPSAHMNMEKPSQPQHSLNRLWFSQSAGEFRWFENILGQRQV